MQQTITVQFGKFSNDPQNDRNAFFALPFLHISSKRSIFAIEEQLILSRLIRIFGILVASTWCEFNNFGLTAQYAGVTNYANDEEIDNIYIHQYSNTLLRDNSIKQKSV